MAPPCGSILIVQIRTPIGESVNVGSNEGSNYRRAGIQKTEGAAPGPSETGLGKKNQKLGGTDPRDDNDGEGHDRNLRAIASVVDAHGWASVFYRRYWAPFSTQEAQLAWERALLSETRCTWCEALKGELQCESIMGRIVVFVGQADLIFFLASSPVARGGGLLGDEMFLEETLSAVVDVLNAQCDSETGGVANVECLWNHMGKVAVGIDELISGGFVNDLDKVRVLRQCKLKTIM